MEIPLTNDGQSYLTITTDTLTRIQYLADLESAIQAQVNSKTDASAFEAIVGIPPAGLNSLQKIANAIGDDTNYNTTITGQLDLKANLTSISNIDNTSDLSKPISTATQTALDLKSNSNNPVFTGLVSLDKISEKISIAGSPSAGVVSVDYTNSGLYHFSPIDDTATLTLNITNVPISNTYKTYIMTILWDATTYKQKFVTVQINSTARTLLFEGDNSVDLSAASLIMQRFAVIHTTSATIPSYVASSVTTFA